MHVKRTDLVVHINPVPELLRQASLVQLVENLAAKFLNMYSAVSTCEIPRGIKANLKAIVFPFQVRKKSLSRSGLVGRWIGRDEQLMVDQHLGVPIVTVNSFAMRN